jgi:hypothetical protein
MLDVAGGIIIAVIVLAIIGKAARYLEKRKAAKLKLAVAHKELQQMNEFVADLERIKKWKVAQARCQYFAKAYVDDKSSGKCYSKSPCRSRRGGRRRLLQKRDPTFHF